NLDAERQLLAGQGVLDRLAQSCRGEMPFSLLYDRPTGGAEIVTAVTPLLTPAGCWAVVASFSAEAFPGAHLGQPYWATPTVQIAAAIYLAMVIITLRPCSASAAGYAALRYWRGRSASRAARPAALRRATKSPSSPKSPPSSTAWSRHCTARRRRSVGRRRTIRTPSRRRSR